MRSPSLFRGTGNVVEVSAGIIILPPNWDEQHDHLSQLLYLTLTSKDVIKSTAPITLGIANRHSQYSNGFGVLQALIRCYHPRVLLSTAPNFEQCFSLRPTLQAATSSHPAYLSLFEPWMDRMRLYHEFGVIHKPSQFSIWFIRGLSLPLRAQLKDQELILLRFQAHHRATTESDLLPETEVAELGQLLDVFAPETSPIEALTKGSTVTAAAIHAVATATMNGVNADDDDFPCDNAPCCGRSHPEFYPTDEWLSRQ
jgi:hypothetical protein